MNSILTGINKELSHIDAGLDAYSKRQYSSSEPMTDCYVSIKEIKDTLLELLYAHKTEEELYKISGKVMDWLFWDASEDDKRMFENVLSQRLPEAPLLNRKVTLAALNDSEYYASSNRGFLEYVGTQLESSYSDLACSAAALLRCSELGREIYDRVVATKELPHQRLVLGMKDIFG